MCIYKVGVVVLIIDMIMYRRERLGEMHGTMQWSTIHNYHIAHTAHTIHIHNFTDPHPHPHTMSCFQCIIKWGAIEAVQCIHIHIIRQQPF